MVSKLFFVSWLSFSLLLPAFKPREVKGEGGAPEIKLYQVASPYDFHTVLQEKYLDDGNLSIAKYAKANAELSRPSALKITWKPLNIDKDKKPSYTLTLSEKEDLSNPWTYRTGESFQHVYNLKLATKYYYAVSASYEDKTVASETKHFFTARTFVRNLNIEGVMNFRDLGGWRNSEGKFMVKQGMIYRSGAFNVSSSSYLKRSITSPGLAEINRLGLKSEIDLRLTSNNEVGGLAGVSPLGSEIKYISCPLDYGQPENIFTYKNNAASFKAIFRALADSKNYPLDIHCADGADRTGCLSFLINGLLGVAEADLYRDYLFTNFSNVSSLRPREAISSSYVKAIKNSPGRTLQDKIVSTLTSIGVDIHDLNSFYYLMQGEGYRI